MRRQPDQVVLACKKSEIVNQINRRRTAKFNWSNFHVSPIFDHFWPFSTDFFLPFGFRRLAKLFHHLIFFCFFFTYHSHSAKRVHTLAENPSEKYLWFINIYVSNWGVPFEQQGQIQIERHTENYFGKVQATPTAWTAQHKYESISQIRCIAHSCKSISHTHTHTRNAAAERTSVDVAAMAISGCRSGGVGFSVWGARATTTIGNWTVQLVRAAQSASRCPDPKISYRRQHLYSHIPSVGRPEDHSSSSSGPLVDLFWPVGQRRGHLPHLHNQKPEPSMAAHKLLAAGPLPCDSRSHSHCDLSILAAFTCRRT